MNSIEEAILIAQEVLIKPFEGYAVKLPDGGCTAYPDPGTGGHPWTIGYGSTGPNIVKGTVWTHAQAEKALEEHILYFASNLLILSPTLARALPRRFAAVISFAYNCGLGNYRISTFKRRVDAEDWEDAAYEIQKWNKAAGRVLPGLTRRRKAEAALLL
jgi:GH24 family phage-related lysozyme (muramidase)